MAEIAAALTAALAARRREGAAGTTTPRLIAAGNGWRVADVVCTCGPDDRAYDEQHAAYAIALVVADVFQQRSATGTGLMTAGSTLVGRPGACFECRHEHSRGDRSLAFWYTPALIDQVAADIGRRGGGAPFDIGAAPAQRAMSALVARGAAALVDEQSTDWNELALDVAAAIMSLPAGQEGSRQPQPLAIARVAGVVRHIDERAERDAALSLEELAAIAGLSPFHFLRTFRLVTGETPHRYVRRARLRDAAARLLAAPSRIIDVALDAGFTDLSTFNRAFREEFEQSPRRFRRDGRLGRNRVDQSARSDAGSLPSRS